MVDRRSLLGGAAASLVLAACGDRTPTPVDPRAYSAFFLWPGVTPPDWLGQAREVYLLAGEVRHRPDSRFVALRATPGNQGKAHPRPLPQAGEEKKADLPFPSRLREGAGVGNYPALWLVIRTERLDWQDAIHREILRTLALWEAAGNHVLGLQVDFDAATRGLGAYAHFLADLRRRLPRRWKLSITGLMDWSAGGDPAALHRLSGSVDDIVVQTYQGRHTIPGYEGYLASLRRLGMPYRVGLVEGGDWRAPAGLETDPAFRGYVVFLLHAGSGASACVPARCDPASASAPMGRMRNQMA